MNESLEYWADILSETGQSPSIRDTIRTPPSWPAHGPWIDDPHIDLVKHRDGTNGTEAEGRKYAMLCALLAPMRTRKDSFQTLNVLRA